MINGNDLVALLHAVATGHTDRALSVIINLDGLDSDLRDDLYRAISDHSDRSVRARSLGDVLLRANADQQVVNEAYRLAFYTSDAWHELAEDPLYAQFVANKAGTITDKWVHYFPVYARHLERFRGKPVRVLEVGVYRGGGLEMWSCFLGPQATLVGLDIDEAARDSVGAKFPVLLGDQADPEVLTKLHDEYGPFDVVIDDGGHTMDQQIVTIETLFPLLNDNGVFICEDTHTSYWEGFGGGLHKPGTFIEWTKRRIDDLHACHEPGIDSTSVWATQVDGIHWYDSIVVLDKTRKFRPFNEVAGSASYIAAPRYDESLSIEMLATRDQALKERDELRAALATLDPEYSAGDPVDKASHTQNELRLARAEMARLRSQLVENEKRSVTREAELVGTRNELLESWAQIKGMRRTVSWRVTMPIRAFRRVLSR